MITASTIPVASQRTRAICQRGIVREDSAAATDASQWFRGGRRTS